MLISRLGVGACRPGCAYLGGGILSPHFGWSALSRGFILMRGAAPRAGYFSLHGQRKVTKRKAAPMSRPSGSLRYSPGAGFSDGTSVCRRKNARPPWRAPCGLIRPGLRCSASQRGLKVKGSSPDGIAGGGRALRARGRTGSRDLSPVVFSLSATFLRAGLIFTVALRQTL
jgi:hypothetical protein